MKYILFICSVFTTPFVFGQYFKITTHRESKPNVYEYTFPLLANKQAKVAAKINRTLQMEELDTLISPGKTGAFSKNFRTSDQIFGGIGEYEYEILRNDSILFTIRFSGEGCGAYCESFEKVYNFNSKDGSQIKIRDLFSAKGYLFLEISVNSQRIKEIRDFVKKAKKEAKTNSTEDAEYQISMYEECMEFKKEFPRKFGSSVDTSFLTDENPMLISQNSIQLTGGRCSNHAMRALDEIYEQITKIKPSDYSDCFRQEFKRFFQLENTPILKQEIYSGKMGDKMDLVLLLTYYSNSKISGSYFYKSQGFPISLKVKAETGGLVLEEFDKNKKTTARFDLQNTTDGLAGTWKDVLSGKNYKVDFFKDQGLLFFR